MKDAWRSPSRSSGRRCRSSARSPTSPGDRRRSGIMDYLIRDASVGDSSAIAGLLSELGYPAEPSAIPRRLRELRTAGTAVALVALNEADVVGLGTAHVFSSIHADEPIGYITTLVVRAASRHQGVGRALVGALEQWTVARGCIRLSVNTGLQRAAAHSFYERLGFNEMGRCYRKPVKSGRTVVQSRMSV